MSSTVVGNRFSSFFCLGKVDLIHNLVVRNLKRKYRGSYLGFLWSLLVPLLMAFTYMVLFSYIMRFNLEHYLPMIVMNILTWSVFAIVAQDGLDTIIANHSILSKVPVPINAFNLSAVVTNFINYLCSFPAITFFLLKDGLFPTVHYLWLPYFLLLYFFVCYFISVILGILYVQFRDLKHLFTVIIQLWMYASPVLYPASMYPPKLSSLVYINPLGPLFVAMHDILIKEQAPSMKVVGAFGIWTVVLFGVALLVYFRYKDRVLENV